jgi:hypothetical protein
LLDDVVATIGRREVWGTLRYAFLRDVESMTGVLLLPGGGGGNGGGAKGEDESGTTKAITAATTSLTAVGVGGNVIDIDE